ncbi:MAG: anthranilate synthase component I [bacterium]|nr:anthranilate synthase component I [bacterium]
MNARPTRQEFGRLATAHRVVPVWRELLADLITPVAAFSRIVGEAPGFLLESTERQNRWSRFSFMGFRPRARIVARGRRVTISGDDLGPVPTEGGVLAALDVILDRFRSPAIDGLPPLHSGLVGYLGYDVVREVERLPNPPSDDLGMPDAVLDVIGRFVAFDHWRQRVFLIQNVILPPEPTSETLDDAYEEALQSLDELARAGARPQPEPLLAPPGPDDLAPETAPSFSAEAYCAAVRAAKEHILDGVIFQVVLSERFDFDLQADPFQLYRALRQVNPSPYMHFLRQPEVTLVGSSPEPMVQLRDGRVTSRPIAGTRPRGTDEREDRRLAGELAEHPKELAEHLMLLDLARNDVGRVVRPGTLSTDELMTLEHYSHVMHLTSQVSGELASGHSPVDVLRATLPAGTVSGAPKVRAMEIIDDLEPTRRGPYAGVVGYLDFSGNLDTAICIRTVAVRDGRAHLQAGAGIVADSVPEEEERECRAKAQALLAAVHAARRMSRSAEPVTPHP